MSSKGQAACARIGTHLLDALKNGQSVLGALVPAKHFRALQALERQRISQRRA